MASTVERVTLTAPDISCGHCVATVEEAVSGLAGVASVSANESSKQVEVSYDPNRVSVAQIEQRLDDAGYPVQK